MSGSAATLLIGLQMLFVGDSITVGTGADPGLGYVDLVADAEPGWDVINAGCGGTTTRDWLAPPAPPDLDEFCAFGGAFDMLAEAHADAEFVHILLGTNDSTGFFDNGATPVTEYGLNVVALAERFSGDVMVSIAIPFPHPDGPEQALLDGYAAELRAIALAPGAPFRLGADFSTLDRALLDGVHPNNAGHAWMADELLPFLVPEPGTGYAPRSFSR